MDKETKALKQKHMVDDNEAEQEEKYLKELKVAIQSKVNSFRDHPLL